MGHNAGVLLTSELISNFAFKVFKGCFNKHGFLFGDVFKIGNSNSS